MLNRRQQRRECLKMLNKMPFFDIICLYVRAKIATMFREGGILKVAWSSSHAEFLISDSYYFSTLERESRKKGIEIVEVADFDELFCYPVIVFNYSEKPFDESEIKAIERAVKNGKRIIFTAHFNNKDNVAEICNAVTERFGMRLKMDEVVEKEHFDEGDCRMVITSRVESYAEGVNQVVFPYSAPIEALHPDVRVIVRGQESAFTGSGERAPVMAAERRMPSGGSLVVCGSCLFWDNYSILRKDNLAFSINLLSM
ncbi:MAG: hypothetical protein PWR01_321 [Clostridiales bacterium]|nr:hypothetical protein [Clostridiales bacterium]